MAPHSSTLAWKIPRVEEHGRLQSMGSLRVGHDWATSLWLFTFMHWRRKWKPTPVFLPGESQGWGAWWAAVYGVAQARTRLKWLSSSSSILYYRKLLSVTCVLIMNIKSCLELAQPRKYIRASQKTLEFTWTHLIREKWFIRLGNGMVNLNKFSRELQNFRVLILASLQSVSAVTLSCLTLRPHGLQYARLPGPSPTPGACLKACPSSWWCHPTISSCHPLSSCLQSFPASGSFPVSQLLVSGGQSIGASASASALPMNIQDWFPLGWADWISLQSKGLSRVFSNTTVQKHQFFGTQLSLWPNSYSHTWLLGKT